MEYNLKKRCLEFSIRVIRFLKGLSKDFIAIEIYKQLLRSAMSIGSNVEEGDGSSSKKDFIHKFTISRKEARESEYWLKILINSDILEDEGSRKVADNLLKEAEEIRKIISAIVKKADVNESNI